MFTIPNGTLGEVCGVHIIGGNRVYVKYPADKCDHLLLADDNNHARRMLMDEFKSMVNGSEVVSR